MDTQKAKKWTALLVVLMFVVMLTVNGLANALPLNGVNTGQLSDEIPNLFVPAGLTFSIWGLIYLLLLGYSVTVLMEAFGRKPSGSWKPADGLIFSLNAGFNAAWIFSWHWRLLPLSLVLMAGILVTLLVLLERLSGEAKRALAGSSAARRFFLRVPILVYLGWICVATIANATALLVVLGWDGFGLSPVIWTVAVILVGTAIGSWLILARGALSSGLVIIWAFAGIVIKRWSIDSEKTMAIIVACLVGMVLLGGLEVLRLRRPVRV